MWAFRQGVCLLFFLLISLHAACSSIPAEINPPRVNLVNFALKEVTLFEQRYDVQLRIANPNDADLGIKGMRFVIELNDKEFANGMSGAKVTVPRFGAELINVDVFTGLGSMLNQLQDIGRSGVSKMRYRLRGTAFIESPSNWKLPFDEKGEIDFNAVSRSSEPSSAQP